MTLIAIVASLRIAVGNRRVWLPFPCRGARRWTTFPSTRIVYARMPDSSNALAGQAGEHLYSSGDGTLTQLARVGDAPPDTNAVDIWSDSAWSDFVEMVRAHGPLPHVDAAGRARIPITDGPILYGALELPAEPSLHLGR